MRIALAVVGIAMLSTACASAALPKTPAGAPRLVAAPHPEYPLEARQQRAEGTVRVVYLIAPDGSTLDRCVAQSVHPLLDQAALDAVSRWRHEPYAKGTGVTRLTASLHFYLTAPGIIRTEQPTPVSTVAPTVSPCPQRIYSAGLPTNSSGAPVLKAGVTNRTESNAPAPGASQPAIDVPPSIFRRPGGAGGLRGGAAQPVLAQTATPPDQIKLATGGYPDQVQLGRDTAGCMKAAGIETMEQYNELLTTKGASNQDIVKKLRALASWMECMNVRGYVVPVKFGE